MIRRHDFFPGSLRAPAWCEKVLSKFGRNQYGEPLFRVIFLPSRCYMVGGYWEQEGELDYRMVPKYSINERKWALERFVPAVWLGSPESWDALGTTLEGYYAIGPFPEHGLFECCAVFSTGFGPSGYVPLEPGMVEMQARLIWAGRMLTRYQVRSAALGEEEEKIRKEDEYFERFLREQSFTRDNPTYGMAVNYNREHAVDDYKQRIIKSRAWNKRHRFGAKGFGQTGSVN